MDYFLTSAHLGFRCWSDQDLPLAMELWGDPEVTALIGGPFAPEMVRARLTEGIARCRNAALSTGRFFCWMAIGTSDAQGFRPIVREPACTS